MSFSIAGKRAGSLGFGLMGLSRPPALQYDTAISVMKAAFDRGANLWSGAEYYGLPNANSLHLLNQYFTTYPDDSQGAILCIKGAFSYSGPDNSSTSISSSIDNCLKILDDKVALDVFLPARIDPNVPIEDTVRTLAKYIDDGRISGYGLSECNAATIRRAHAVHPISVIEIELSLFSIEAINNGVARICEELGIAIIAYSPLSRGFLTGHIKTLDDLPQTDSRRMFPRFGASVFDSNALLVTQIEEVANKTGYSMPQVALAWVADQSRRMGTAVIPIPGCTTVARVEENFAKISIKEEDLNELSKQVGKMLVLGDRYPEAFQKYVDL